MNSETLCMGCMEEMGAAAVCSNCGRGANQPAASPLHLPPRTVLHNQYLLGRALGHGGFGITYLGWDLNLARKLAVKEYLPGGMGVRSTGSQSVTAYSGQAEAFQWGLEKFLEEARVLARFQHQPGIVAVLNFFRENETAYLVMEYLDGITLQEYLSRHGEKIDPRAALKIMLPVMDALRVVHQAGVLHRDISPDNIYVCGTGQVKVLDFGAARYALSQQSRSLSVILKEGYAPEEQYRSKGNQGPWTDVYAAAGTFYRAITGRVPPPALDRREQDELVPPIQAGAAISAELETALMKALAIRSADRFASMDEFQAAVMSTPEAAGAASLDPKTIASFGSAMANRETRVLPRQPIQTEGETRFVPKLKKEEKPSAAKPGLLAALPFAPKWLAAGLGLLLLGGGFLFFRGGKPAPSAGPKIRSFRAENNRIERGKSAILTWDVTGDGDVSLDPGGKPVPRFGSSEVHPDQTTSYTLSVRTRGGIDAQKVTVEVVNPPPAQATVVKPAAAGDQPREAAPPPSLSPERDNRRGIVPPSPPPARPLVVQAFTVEPPMVQPGQVATLHWSVPGATHVEIAPVIGTVQPEGHLQVTPRRSGTFYLTATNNSGGRVTATASVDVPQAAQQQAQQVTPLEIASFGGPPSPIAAGQPAMLRWSVRGASQVVIMPQIGTVPAEGMRPVYPRSTTAYTLVANAAGHAPVQATATVEVIPPANTAYGQNDPQRNPPQMDGRPRGVNSPPAERGFTTAVLHDHGGAVGGTLGRVIPRIGRAAPPSNGYCSGQLIVQPPSIRFNSGSGDGFTTSLSEVSEVGLNRVPIQNSQAFHIRLRNGNNYNFVPRGQSASWVVGEIQRLLH